MFSLIFRGLKDVARNPVAILIAAIAASFAILYASNLFVSNQLSPLAKALNALAIAILTSGTLGVLFEYVNKGRLIKESIQSALGQTRAMDLGIADIKLKVSEISYQDDIINSHKLIIGSRYSSSFLDRHKDDIRKRLLKKRRALTILHMKDASIFPHTRQMTRTPEDFFRELKIYDQKICDNATVLKTEQKLCYNFVQTDRGIWAKLYFNSPQQELPPAFFVSEGSPLFASFAHDIDLLIKHGEAVQW